MLFQLIRRRRQNKAAKSKAEWGDFWPLPRLLPTPHSPQPRPHIASSRPPLCRTARGSCRSPETFTLSDCCDRIYFTKRAQTELSDRQNVGLHDTTLSPVVHRSESSRAEGEDSVELLFATLRRRESSETTAGLERIDSGRLYCSEARHCNLSSNYQSPKSTACEVE